MQIKPFSCDSKNSAGFALIERLKGTQKWAIPITREVDFKTYTVNTIVALDILNDINKTSIGDRFH